MDEVNDVYYIWTHKKFDIGYNENQIVDVNLTSEARQKLELGAKIKFTYEVNWKKSNVKFEDRFDKYLDPNFFQHRVGCGVVCYTNGSSLLKMAVGDWPWFDILELCGCVMLGLMSTSVWDDDTNI